LPLATGYRCAAVTRWELRRYFERG